MIRCTLELIRASNGEVVKLGEIHIQNHLLRTMETGGSRGRSRGDYGYEIYKKRKSVWRRGKIRDFPRQSYHPWNLILRILKDAAEQNGGII